VLLAWAGPLVGCVSDEVPAGAVARHQGAVIYGVDDRLDVHAHPDPQLRLLAQRSVVALFPAEALREDAEGRVRVPEVSLAQAAGVCPDEAFAQQPIGPDCSGTLVGPDLVLTAGHCLEVRPCADLRLVFGWHTIANETMAPITADDVYRCARYEVSALDEEGRDHALIRLDRRVNAARQPAPIRTSHRALAAGTAVRLIGYPSGLPAKIDDGGQVTASRVVDDFGFFATMDAFGGNSGSGVFDAEGRVVGVLVSGNEDYAFDPAAGCLRVRVLSPETTEAERAVYPAEARAALCSGNPDDALCAPPEGPWCAPCQADEDACGPDFVCGLTGTCVSRCQGAFDCRADHVCRGGLCVRQAGALCGAPNPDAEVVDAEVVDAGVSDASGPADVEPPDLAAPDLMPPLDAEPPDAEPLDAEPLDARAPRDRGPGYELGPDTDAWAPPSRRPPNPRALDAATAPPAQDPGLPVTGAEAPEYRLRLRPECSQAADSAPPGLAFWAVLGLLGGGPLRRRQRRQSPDV
jgi:MYXO-CTERM domain-containing protein